MSSRPEPARVEITPPKLLTTSAVLSVTAYGLVLMLPVLLSLMAVSLFQLGVLTFLIPLLTFAVATLFLPLGFGNPHVARLARSLRPGGASTQTFLVQLTLVPRVRSGLRGLLDDADDIGWLCLGDSALEFSGDSIRLSVGFDQIKTVVRRSIGMRGLFVYPCLEIPVSGLSNVETLRIAERSSWLLPASRRRTREIQRRMVDRIRMAQTRVAP